DAAAGTVGASDSGGNAYSVSADVTNASHVRTVILAAHNVVGFPAGGMITVTHPSVAARALAAAEFSGLASSATLDRTSIATGSSASPSSGTTALTSQADELVIGAIGAEGPSSDTLTAGASFVSLASAGTSGNSAASNITIDGEFRVVSATGAYAASGTLGSSRDWAAAIVTFK